MARIAKLPVAEPDPDAAEQSPAGVLMLQLPDAEPHAQSPEGVDDVMASAAALRQVDQVVPNLPVQLTSFVGREAEMTQVHALLAGRRLVTLTGAGGVGKTRLAVEVAARVPAEFPGGVWLVELAPLADASLIPVTVARALGLPDAPGRSAIAAVTGFIGPRRTLIVLDNCEHLLDGCAQLIEDLLRACPALVVLATSREPICAAGEATWLVPSLPLDGAAIDLFADRGLRVRRDFAITPENHDAVTEICRRLDGIPLAIELAAARLRAFSPDEIVAGLHDRFRLLTGGARTAARRQQTLRASVDWSHALLTEPERTLFRRLAAFAGGFDLAAVQAVVGVQDLLGQVLNLLALLVGRSLVAAEEWEGVTRYRLPETIRQYAMEILADSGEADQVRTRHRDYYTALASQLDRSGGGDRRRLIRRLEAEIDNLRAAFAWCLELSDREAALRLASSLQPLWVGKARMLEGLAWFDVVLKDRPVDPELIAAEVRVRALADIGILDGYTTPPTRAALVSEAVPLARQLGDPALLGRALFGAASSAGYLGTTARAHLEEAIVLARQAGDVSTLAGSLARQAFAASIVGDPVAARKAAEEGLDLAQQTANDHISRSCRVWLTSALVTQGEIAQARSLATGLIAEAEAEHAPLWKLYGLALLGITLAITGQPGAARACAKASIAIADDLGLAVQTQAGYSCLAYAAAVAGDLEALREASEAGWQRVKTRPEYGLVYQIYMAEAHLAAGDITAARQQVDLAIGAAATFGMKGNLAEALLTSAFVSLAAGDLASACADAHRALTISREIRAVGVITAELECLGEIAAHDDYRKAARLLGAADALRRHAGYTRVLLYQARQDAAVLALRTAMGDAAFTQARDEGAALSLDEAVSYALRGRGERKRPETGWLSLTPAERDVVRLVVEGLANKEIATQLFISPRTVQAHLTHVYGKLRVTSRVQLAQQAALHAADS